MDLAIGFRSNRGDVASTKFRLPPPGVYMPQANLFLMWK